jgi:hypothetical protein
MPTYEENVAALEALFGSKITASPVPAIAAQLDATVAKVSAKVTSAEASADGAWLQFVKANPAISTTGQVTVQVWAQLIVLAQVKSLLLSAAQDLSSFKTAVSQWEENNSGSLLPSTPPSLPATLAQFNS